MKNIRKIVIAIMLSCVVLMEGSLLAHAEGVLSIALSSGSVAVGDSLTVTIYANGSDNSEVTADMKITYDSSKLEYVGSSKSGASGGGGTVSVSGSEVELKFKALASGDAKLKAEGVAVTAAGATVSVGGQASSESKDKKEETTTDNKTEEKTEEEKTNAALSGDNSLTSMSISSGTLSPSFQGKTTKYTASVGSDVSEIKVNAVPANSKAVIESVTGNTGLKEGTNTVNVVVKAENGAKATYSITVTKSSTPTAAKEDTTTNKTEDKTEDKPEVKPEDSANATTETGAVAATGMITINGINYSISEDFTKEEIPEHFAESTVEYGGKSCTGFIYDKGPVGLFYLVSEAGDKKGFFVYDSGKDKFYPFEQLKSQEGFIIPILTPDGTVPPENYEGAELMISEAGAVQAYQYMGSAQAAGADAEAGAVSTETAENSAQPASEFYLFYAIDNEGAMGWYQYDTKQKTYQRLNGEMNSVSAAANEEDYNKLLLAYNEVNDDFEKTKSKDRKVTAVMIFVIAVLIIIIINLFLRGRGRDNDDWDDDDDDEDVVPLRKTVQKERLLREKANRDSVRDEKIKEKRIPKENVSKESPVIDTIVKESVVKNNPVREDFVKKTMVKENTIREEDSFYDDDDDEAFSEFEMDPHMISRGNRKKEERGKVMDSHKKTTSKKKEPEKPSEDDDIEFLDLNDL